MSKRVFRHHTQAELDRNYDQRGWVSNALEVIARYPIASAATRQRLTFQTVAYGPSADEVLDIFPAGQKSAATLVFIHGGAWQNFTKDDCSFVAEGFVGHGINVVIVNFAKIGVVGLQSMVEQVRRALTWVRLNCAVFGGDAERLFLCGHSSGAHLASSALLAPFGAPAPQMRGLTLISGAYDLEPVLLSARSAYIRLSPDEAALLSPQRHVSRLTCPVLMAYCDNDTDEFQRHSREMAEAVERVGQLAGLMRLPDLNHFEIVEELGKPESRLARSIRAAVS